jgi:intracellular sulfur oxidation DsrE/DsrF family protein
MKSKPQAGVLIHAPTAAAVERARNNAANLLKAEPHAMVRILVNADGVAALLDTPRDDTDPFTLVCANTLSRIDRRAQPPLQTIPSSIVALVQMQRDGWLYVRA